MLSELLSFQPHLTINTTMKNQSSFILNPRVYGEAATLHLIVVNDNGVKLGVITTEIDGALHVEALAELHNFERKVVIDRIKKEIADGKIDKAFVHDMCNRACEKEFADIVPLFQYVPTDSTVVQSLERDRINSLLQGLQVEPVVV